jgi:hypothetical protein|tara:strand:+ start:361 stop:483 length:123 start_codon:yes stop_codon:yes gene_type:complete
MRWLREKISMPPAFVAVMLRNVPDTFDEQLPEAKSICGCR